MVTNKELLELLKTHKIKDEGLLKFIDESANLCKPDKIVLIDGSSEQIETLRAQACSTGEMYKLNQELLPDCYYHRTAVNDVARVEGRTFICTKDKHTAGPTNNWMETSEAFKILAKHYDGAMAGRTMYIIPYSMGPVTSQYSKNGIELTDSIYVCLNMAIMTRVGLAVLANIERSHEFVKGLHSKAQLSEEGRYICQFPEENLICSVNSGYGGNVLLGKKCFALRIASYLGWKEGWMAEHMLILGIEKDGVTRYITAAFPSACGKTNLAMLIPPEGYIKKGYKVWCVGDDISWINVGPDGRLWAINPENGFFGVAPGTNEKSNPNALASTKQGTLFTNVVLNTENDTVWWEGLDKNPPKKALDWYGNPWNGEMGTKGAHPNSRFTAPAINCPCISSEFEAPNGVPISAMIFGGRRAKTAPLVYQARDWNHGVFIGSIMASETTAAASGAVGVVRRDPMAMLPFCGYNMGDYFTHWIEMGKKVGDKAPKIFNVNWFRTDDEGHFIWPGFGDNMRILDWIIERSSDNAEAVDSPIGYQPKAEDINLEGLDLSVDTVRDLLSVDKATWADEAKGIEEFYQKFGDDLPQELRDQLEILKKNVNA
ncbi:MAG: phosphoenolpyruvate carboxykinase (GTP) [Clostridia bacterium]